MREIKFRAWDKNTKTLIRDVFVLTPGATIINGRGLAHDCVLMQYTGLKDKNGVEIYEGDILQIVGGTMRALATVRFDEGSFLVNNPVGGDLTLRDAQLIPHATIEIIGNIYEHKELLHG